MKCPKCGHWSLFDFPTCRKCGLDVNASESTTKSFREKDNLGTRYDNEHLASNYFITRITGNITIYGGSASHSIQSPGKTEPYLLYEFNSEKEAISALLDLPCIHLAKDSNKLICSEVLGFGYYKCKETEKYETLLCGEDMTFELWHQAENSFLKNGGRKLKCLEPKKEITNIKEEKSPSEKVIFVRKDTKNVLGVNAIYEVYKGPDSNTAKSFLKNKSVNEKFYCIVVETPDGNYCRDIQGFYKE